MSKMDVMENGKEKSELNNDRPFTAKIVINSCSIPVLRDLLTILNIV